MSHIIELKKDESQTFDDLTLTLTGGGHKILADENGRRAGDLSFATITFQTPRVAAESKMVYNNKAGKSEKEITFDNYVLSVKEMEWNGKSVTLTVTKK